MKSSYRLFVTNRFLRIYPIYWTVVLLTVIFSGFMLWRGVDNGDLTGYVHSYAPLLRGHAPMIPFAILGDIIQNITIIIHCGYFSRCHTTNLNTMGVVWTLNLELLFYLIAPFLLRRKGFARIGVIAGVYLLWFIVFHFDLLSYYSTAYAFLHAMKLFMLGFISFVLYERLPLNKLPPLTLVGICLAFLAFILLYSHIPIPFLRYKWLMFNDYIYYLGVTAALPFLFQFSNIIRFDAFIAQLSYPIYISHLFTNEVLTTTNVLKPHTQTFSVIGLLFVLIFSFAMVYILEDTINRYRQMRAGAAKVPKNLL